MRQVSSSWGCRKNWCCARQKTVHSLQNSTSIGTNKRNRNQKEKRNGTTEEPQDGAQCPHATAASHSSICGFAVHGRHYGNQTRGLCNSYHLGFIPNPPACLHRAPTTHQHQACTHVHAHHHDERTDIASPWREHQRIAPSRDCKHAFFSSRAAKQHFNERNCNGTQNNTKKQHLLTLLVCTNQQLGHLQFSGRTGCYPRDTPCAVAKNFTDTADVFVASLSSSTNSANMTKL